jgi:hypothetical protein
MTQEALKLALEALELCNGAETVEGVVIYTNKEITAIKEALSQRTEQEPVAYLCENAVGHKYFRWKKPSSTYKPIALYTTPPQRTWHGLTDEEIDYIYTGIRAVHHDVDSDVLCRAIEAKLKEKNGA